jgi:hypothetical protein
MDHIGETAYTPENAHHPFVGVTLTKSLQIPDISDTISLKGKPWSTAP